MAGMGRRSSGQAKRIVSVAVLGAAVLVALTVVRVGHSSAPAATVSHRPSVHDPKVRALVRILGVLRRPQTEADRNPTLLREGLRGPGVAPVISLLRLATTTSWGDKVFLVPLVSAPTHLPLARSRGGLGMFSVNGGGGCCSTAAQIEGGEDYANGLSPRSLIMVVPDHVARITVRLSAPLGRRQPPIATGRVHANVAVVRLPFDVESGGGDIITWYDASGAIIKRVSPRAS
jgi:hypothetical protein